VITVGDSATQVKIRSEDFLSVHALPETILTAFRKRLPTGICKWLIPSGWTGQKNLSIKHLFVGSKAGDILDPCIQVPAN
jgi:hypothetical protein